ncbi:hypothetical protein H5410_000273 [Solanum commersonii]|uniref:CCHC-type domain-containing protein n=1 Tax=Solanum commersonii TaxID=4109 RepID=A0A9J6AVT9_SOLCO|nr:hypothetical protein H5410_000273 [Solanum commersonii]
MLERDFTLSNGEITKSVFPPQQSFQINKNDKIVNFNAFSKLFENDTALITTQHINVMIKQNNYANIYMSILGDHVISLHEKVDKLIALLPTKLKGKEKVGHSSLQPPPEIEDFKIKDYSDLENFLEKKFKGGGVQPINVENFDEGEPSNKKEFYDNLNKISEKYARKLVQRIVRKAIRGDNHSINYDDYTYEKLISACVQEGLSLCNEIKLNQQIKRHRLNERKQLGEFCEQFAFDIPKQKSKDKDSPHKKKKSSKKDYEKWKKKKIEKKLRRAEEGKGDSSKRKKKYRQNFNKSDTCHKCGRYGHYAKDCRVKEKIKSLHIEENLKDSLYKIMLNSDSGSGIEYSRGEESSTSEDLKALQ